MTKAHEAFHKDVILSSAGITASIVLADPIVFLSGFSKHEQAERPPALVRGSLILRVTKATKIKAINLGFKGISRTDWPEGIPSDKSETHETKEVFSHEWRLFSSQFSNADKSSGAHSVSALEPESDGLQPTLTATTAHELVNQHEAVHKGYRVFNPAEYVYNFELMLPQRLPETLKCNFGQVRWGFALSIERHGTFKPNLTASKEVTLLRTLGPSNLESSEPIVISRDWEDLLHYEIIIAGKAFAIGQKFNVAFGLVALAKVKCHRIRIYITEHTEYFCRNHRIHRVEPSHKFLLLERKSPEGNRGDLLNTTEPGMSGLTEFEFNVEIPESFPARRDRLRPNANTEYIKVYHWIKAVMRLSRQDIKQNGEPKCYEVSIDSPITLVDPRTMTSNDLPDYQTAKRRTSIVDALKPYREFIQNGGTPHGMGGGTDPGFGAGAGLGDLSSGGGGGSGGGSGSNSSDIRHDSNAGSSNSSAAPYGAGGDQESTERAILFTRQPSIAPPPFDADIKPPELLPPQYDATQESAESYERRYEEYLIATGRLPPRVPFETATPPPPLLTETALPDNASDSNASTLSQHSDRSSGSTAHTAADDVASTKPAFSASPTGSPTDRSQNAVPAELRPPVEPRPIFSEIIWTEDSPTEPQSAEDIDPRQFADSTEATPEPEKAADTIAKATAEAASAAAATTQPALEPVSGPKSGPVSKPNSGSVSPQGVPQKNVASGPETPSADHSLRAQLSKLSMSNRAQTSNDASPSQSPVLSPTSSAPRKPSYTSASAFATASAMAQATAVNADKSSPRSIPKQGIAYKNIPFSPPLSHNQLARSSVVGSAGTNSDFTGMSPGNAFQSRRPSGHQAGRVPFRTPLSVSAGSPLTSPWSADTSNGPSLFSERWTDKRDWPERRDWSERRDSSSSSTSSRIFRQSSVISVDVTRQISGGESVGPMRDSIWGSRRPSRVGEVQELRDWPSRRNSDASVAISIAEYQGLGSERQHANTPLLGDEESEMDIGLEWEHDFEDFNLDSDRRSVVSAFYTVLTP